MISLRLPFPPSANSIWRNVNGRTLKSAPYRAWLRQAGLEALIQRPSRVLGGYHMMLVATPPDRRKRDLGNLLKATEDFLVQGGYIEDDHLARSINLAWGQFIVKGGYIDITVTPA